MAALPILRGAIPVTFPPGWYARNGLDLGHALVDHPLDAGGFVDRVTFPPAIGAEPRVATLQTARVRVEPGGRGMFGSGNQFGFTVQNAANTSLFRHGGRLFAMWEGGLPTELEEPTLHTLGHARFAGARRGLPVTTGCAFVDVRLGLGGDAVSAHPVMDPVTGRAVVLLSSIGLSREPVVQYRILELHPHSVAAERERLLSVSGFTHVHGAMFVTRDFYILITPCMSLDARSYVMGHAMADCIRHEHAPTTLHVIPRDAAGQARSYEMPRCFVTHGVNAYQTYGTIVVDAMVADCLPHPTAKQRMMPDVRMRRIVLYEQSPEAKGCDLFLHKKPKKAGGARGTWPFQACVPRLGGGRRLKTGHASLEMRDMYCGPVEFPCMNPRFVGRVYRFAYMTADPWGWVKVDVTTGRTWHVCCMDGPHLEPAFVPRSPEAAEDEGWIVGFVLRAGRSVFCIVDAQRMKVVCVMDAAEANQIGLHGFYVVDT